MQTLRLRHPITADRQITLTRPPDFPMGPVETLPPTGRTREDIDRQVQEERDSWERSRYVSASA